MIIMDYGVEGEKEVEEVTIHYFRDIFSSTNLVHLDNALREVQSIVSKEMNQSLIRSATEEKIKEILFFMHLEEVPGPDEMTTLFLQKSWTIIKDDLVRLVTNILIH